jgi:hypothetical protein
MINTSHYFHELDVSQALCAETDPEVFFPEKGESARPAREICGECAIRVECLQVALSRGYNDGIWGGLTPKERAKLRGVKWNRGRVGRKITNAVELTKENN